MKVYIAVNETESGEKNVLGAFTKLDNAKHKLGEYLLENPEEECWLEPFDTEDWQYETGEECHMIHRTRVHKTTGMKTHVIVFTKEEVPLVEECGDWFIICREDNSFDREEGMKKNLQVLEEYLSVQNIN